jgi:hypothetical protein
VDFLIIYTRESHPVGEWEVERNRRAGILVEQPQTLDQRKALARQAKNLLKINLPIALDNMENETATAYDGFTTAAVIVGRDGTILARRNWTDTHSLRRSIDQAIAQKPATQPEG